MNFNLWNFVFDTDGPRIIGIFSDQKYIADTNRHPLYALFFKTVTRLIDSHVHDESTSTLLVTAGIGAMAIPAAFLIFLKIVRSETDAFLFAVILGCSSSTWLLSSLPETFSINLAMLVMAFLFQMNEGNGRWKHTAFAVFYTFIAAGITIANSVYAVSGYVNYLRKRGEKLQYAAFHLLVFGTVFLILMGVFTHLQRALYPGAGTLISPGDYAGIFTTEKDYFNFNPGVVLSADRIIILARTMLVDNLIAPKSEIKIIDSLGLQWTIIGFGTGWAYLLLALAYAVLATTMGVKIIQQKSYRDKDVQLAAGFLAFNLVFHLFYQGVGIPFIYSIHAVFSLVFLLAWLFKSVDFKFKRLVLLAVVLAVVVNNSIFIGRVNKFLNTNLTPIDHNRGNGRPYQG
jgi:hypothetical protein